MHTWYYRLNALATVASTTLAVMCALASVSEVLHRSQPHVEARLARVDGLAIERGNERAWITFDVDADLRSVFNWNTKQAYVWVSADFATRRNAMNSITLWDRIVQSAARADVRERQVKVQWPFTLTDQGRGLRGAPFNLTVAWQSVPYSGLLLAGSRTFTGFRMPAEYTGSTQPPQQWR